MCVCQTKAQSLLRARLAVKIASDAAIHIPTMLQGMEKAVIILSTAVTRPGAFASDAQRLNVALTRARQHLFIVGEGNDCTARSCEIVWLPYHPISARRLNAALTRARRHQSSVGNAESIVLMLINVSENVI